VNIKSKEEACVVLATEYADIAKASGFDHKDVFNTYMTRCMTRNNEIVAEQVMREAYEMVKKNPETSWVQEWHKERQARYDAEKKAKELEVKINKSKTKEIDSGDRYLMSYSRNLTFL